MGSLLLLCWRYCVQLEEEKSLKVFRFREVMMALKARGVTYIHVHVHSHRYTEQERKRL